MAPDLADPAFKAGAHPIYADWRRTGPVRRARQRDGRVAGHPL
jgi:hypothetical protein